MSGISGSVIDCKVCSSEEVIPIVAGRWRKHFHCSACGQMVHVREEDIRRPGLPEPLLDPVRESSSPTVNELPDEDPAPSTSSELLTPTLVEHEAGDGHRGRRKSTESVSSTHSLARRSPSPALNEVPMSPDSWLSSEPSLSPNYQSLLLRSPFVASPVQRAQGRSLEDDVLRGYIYRPPQADLEASDGKMNTPPDNNSGDDAASDLYAAEGPLSPALLSSGFSLGGNWPNSLPPSPKSMPPSGVENNTTTALGSLSRSENVSPSLPLDAVRHHSASEPHSPAMSPAMSMLTRNTSLKLWVNKASRESPPPPPPPSPPSARNSSQPWCTTKRSEEEEEEQQLSPMKQQHKQQEQQRQQRPQVEENEVYGSFMDSNSNAAPDDCASRGNSNNNNIDDAWRSNQDLDGITIPPLPSAAETSSSFARHHHHHPQHLQNDVEQPLRASPSFSKPLTWHSTEPSTADDDYAVEQPPHHPEPITADPDEVGGVPARPLSHDHVSPLLHFAAARSLYMRQASSGSWVSAASSSEDASAAGAGSGSPHPLSISIGGGGPFSPHHLLRSTSQPSSPALHHSSSPGGTSSLRTSGSWRDMRKPKRTTLRSLEHSYGHAGTAAGSSSSPPSSLPGSPASTSLQGGGPLSSHRLFNNNNGGHGHDAPSHQPLALASASTATTTTTPLKAHAHARALPRSQLSSSSGSSPPPPMTARAANPNQLLRPPDLPLLQVAHDAAAADHSSDGDGGESPLQESSSPSSRPPIFNSTITGSPRSRRRPPTSTSSPSFSSPPKSPLSLVDPAPLPLSPPGSPSHAHGLLLPSTIGSEQQQQQQPPLAFSPPVSTPSSPTTLIGATNSFARRDTGSSQLGSLPCGKQRLGPSPLSPRGPMTTALPSPSSSSSSSSLDVDALPKGVNGTVAEQIHPDMDGSRQQQEEEQQQQQDIDRRSSQEMDMDGDEDGGEFTFAQVYEGPPLEFDIPVAMPLGYVHNSVFTPTTTTTTTTTALGFDVDAHANSRSRRRRSSESAMLSDSCRSASFHYSDDDGGRGDGPQSSPRTLMLLRRFSMPAVRVATAAPLENNNNNINKPILEGLFPTARAVLAGGYQPHMHRLSSPEHDQPKAAAGATVSTGVLAAVTERAGEEEEEEPRVPMLAAVLRNKGRGVSCSLCQGTKGVKEKCLVCLARYCRRCLPSAMGEMSEGRKCDRCVGRPIHEALRPELGKTRLLQAMGFSAQRTANIMRAELECEANQVQAPVMVNGRWVTEEEMGCLMSCARPPDTLVPGGRYWYDRRSGLWGKVGERPDCRITAGLRVSGVMPSDCSCRSTNVFLNSREIGRVELSMLEMAGVECRPGSMFHVDADGTFGEEGQTRGDALVGNLWEKSYLRFLSSSVCPKQPIIAKVAEETIRRRGGVTSMAEAMMMTMSTTTTTTAMMMAQVVPATDDDYGTSSSSSGTGDDEGTHNTTTVLVLGTRGAGCATLMKQMKLLYSNSFLLGELRAYKALVLQSACRALCTLLEARARYDAEEEEEEDVFATDFSSDAMAAAAPAAEHLHPLLAIDRQRRRLSSLPEDSSAASKSAAVGQTPSNSKPNGATGAAAGGGGGGGPVSKTKRMLKLHRRSGSEVFVGRRPYALENEEREVAAQAILALRDEGPRECTEEMANAIHSLWRDPGVQATYERCSAEMPDLSPFADIFLDKVLVMPSREYRPSAEDMLRAEGMPTRGFQVSGGRAHAPALTFTFLDNTSSGDDGAQQHPHHNKGARRFCMVKVPLDQNAAAVAESMDRVDAVLFCVALSDYDVVGVGGSDAGVNRLEAARDAFACALEWIAPLSRPLILLLNKFDLFSNKLQAGSPLSSCSWLATTTTTHEGEDQGEGEAEEARVANGGGQTWGHDDGAWQEPQEAYSRVVAAFRRVYVDSSCGLEDPAANYLFTCQLNALNPRSVQMLLEYVNDILKWRQGEDGSSDDVGVAKFNLQDLSFVPDKLSPST